MAGSYDWGSGRRTPKTAPCGSATTAKRPTFGMSIVLDERRGAELLRLRDRCVSSRPRRTEPAGRGHRRVGQRHQAPDARLAGDEDPIAAEVGAHVLGRPAEDLAVEARGAVDVGRAELVPHEDALGERALRGRLERAHEAALRVADDRHPADLGHVERARRERSARRPSPLDRLVDVATWTCPSQCGGGAPSFAVPKPPWFGAARVDHRVLHLAGLQELGPPAKELRVEVLRLSGSDETWWCQTNRPIAVAVVLISLLPRDRPVRGYRLRLQTATMNFS